MHGHKLDIFALTETWVSDKTPDAIRAGVAPEGYIVHHEHKHLTVKNATHRGEGVGSGIAIITHLNISLKIMSTLSYPYSSFELLLSKLAGSMKHIILGIIYRPPCSSISTFINELTLLLDGSQGLDFVLGGDFNPGSAGSLLDVQLKSLLSSYCLIQHVSTPTRYLNTLDLVITPADTPMVHDLFVVNPSVSDHKLVSLCLGVQSIPISDTLKRFRQLANLDSTRLISLVNNSKIVNSSFNDPDSFCKQFEDDVTATIDTISPFRTNTRKDSNRPSHHFMLTPEACAAKVYMRKFDATISSSSTPRVKRAYNIACRKANKLTKSCRQDYLTSLLSESSSDLHTLWGAVKRILHPNKDPQITDPRWDQ